MPPELKQGQKSTQGPILTTFGVKDFYFGPILRILDFRPSYAHTRKNQTSPICMERSLKLLTVNVHIVWKFQAFLPARFRSRCRRPWTTTGQRLKIWSCLMRPFPLSNLNGTNGQISTNQTTHCAKISKHFCLLVSSHGCADHEQLCLERLGYRDFVRVRKIILTYGNDSLHCWDCFGILYLVYTWGVQLVRSFKSYFIYNILWLTGTGTGTGVHVL